MNPHLQPNEDNDTNNNQQPQNNWSYSSGNLQQPTPQSFSDNNVNESDSEELLLEWSAAEFIEHDKSPSWYGGLSLVTIVFSTIMYFITREYMTIIVVVLMAIAFAIYGSLKPKQRIYRLTNQGLWVDNEHYDYSLFKSFSIINEQRIPYIQILFHKRFSIPLTIYIDPNHSDAIADIIGDFVPYDQKKQDFADRLSNRLRF